MLSGIHAKVIFFFIWSVSCISNFNRADHVIIQSYEEQLDDRRLYVAVFIKDPYRQDIALTNDQFLLALKRNQQQLYQDIKHYVCDWFYFTKRKKRKKWMNIDSIS